MKRLISVCLFVLPFVAPSLEAAGSEVPMPPLSAAASTPESDRLAVVPNAVVPDAVMPNVLVPNKARVRVNCEGGQSLQQTIDRLRIVSPLEVEFTGVCEENILIARDDLTVRGMDEGATVKGHFDVQGASRIHLEDFTIRDSISTEPILDREGDGLRLVSSTGVHVEGVTIINAGSRGLSCEGASAVFRNVSVLDSIGINVVWIGSTIVIYEDFYTSGSPVNGIVVFNTSNIFVRPEAMIESTNNPGGMFIEGQSSLTLGIEAKITVNNNLGNGLLLIGEGTLLYSNGIIESVGNGGFGIGIADLSHLSPFIGTTAEIIVADNVAGGVIMVRRSAARFQAGTVIENNTGAGLFVDDSSLLLGDITHRGNGGGGAIFGFGARVSAFAPSDFATTPFCEPSVLIRGPITCVPPPAPAAVTIAPPEIDLYQGLPEISRRAMRALHAQQ